MALGLRLAEITMIFSQQKLCICQASCTNLYHIPLYEPGSKLLALAMVIQPLIGNPYNGYINPYYWVDNHPLLYGNINNGSLDPSTYRLVRVIS